MPDRKPRPKQQPVGGDIDWYVISIDRLKKGALLFVIIVAGSILAYFVYSRTRRSPEERARIEVVNAEQAVGRAAGGTSSGRPGSHLSQARELLREAQAAQAAKKWDEAFRLAVESQSYSSRALGGAGTEEAGDASFIFVEADVSVQSAGRATF